MPYSSSVTVYWNFCYVCILLHCAKLWSRILGVCHANMAITTTNVHHEMELCQAACSLTARYPFFTLGSSNQVPPLFSQLFPNRLFQGQTLTPISKQILWFNSYLCIQSAWSYCWSSEVAVKGCLSDVYNGLRRPTGAQNKINTLANCNHDEEDRI